MGDFVLNVNGSDVRVNASREETLLSVPVSYTHLDVYKRQGKNLDVGNQRIGFQGRRHSLPKAHFSAATALPAW